ncbi:alcohol dehydrogenase [Nostoc sp. 3335mG]|nr:alcohol dehydrogenase [Nostoc sp. 3335mG]
MNPFAFHYGPRLVMGEGASARIGDWIAPGPVLFVTDAQVLALGLADEALERLRTGGRVVTVFDAVEADPSRATLEAAVAAGREAGAASVVGFGGGSPMDVAKVAAYLLGSGDDLEAIWGVGNARGEALPLVLVPTTAGTGSEATPVSIITLPGDEKRGVSSPALIAGHAVLDPLLTIGLPRSITAATGMDAMVHAIEAYTSAHLKNPMSDMLAREALRLLAGNLLKACDTPGDATARSAMLLGAHLAGVAFANAPVAGVHALAYPLGGRFHLPHGLSNVLMLPHVLGFNMGSAMPLYAELGPIVDPALKGLGRQAQAAGLVAALRRMSVEAGMPQHLREVGVASADLDTLAADAMRQERLLRNNPRPIALEDARSLYEAAL